MKISLSPDVELLIARKLASGRYHSADEVVREGLELLEEHEKQPAPRTANGSANLAASFADISNGVSEAEWESLPSDLFKNLDHYLYGKPKPD